LSAQWNFVLFVGEKEASNGTVDITDRDDQKKRQVMRVDELNEMFKSKMPPKS
jgi:threonyl-tRNA synthetase